MTLFSLILFLTGVFYVIKHDRSNYMGILYTDYNDLSKQEYQKGFKTLDECKQWAYDTADGQELEDGSWDYECGIGCEIKDTGFQFRKWSCENVTKGNLFSELKDRIRDLSITDGDTITSSMTITGHARNMFYEGTFPVTIVSSDGLVLYNGLAVSDGDWMTEEFIPFTIEIDYFDPQGSAEGLLILENDNPSGLDEYDFTYVVEVVFPE